MDDTWGRNIAPREAERSASSLTALIGRNHTRKPHPQATPLAVVEKVAEIARLNPIWGCCKLAQELKHVGILLSSPTIQKILIRYGLGNRRERAVALLSLCNATGLICSPDQQRQILRILVEDGTTGRPVDNTMGLTKSAGDSKGIVTHPG